MGRVCVCASAPVRAVWRYKNVVDRCVHALQSPCVAAIGISPSGRCCVVVCVVASLKCVVASPRARDASQLKVEFPLPSRRGSPRGVSFANQHRFDDDTPPRGALLPLSALLSPCHHDLRERAKKSALCTTCTLSGVFLHGSSNPSFPHSPPFPPPIGPSPVPPPEQSPSARKKNRAPSNDPPVWREEYFLLLWGRAQSPFPARVLLATAHPRVGCKSRPPSSDATSALLCFPLEEEGVHPRHIARCHRRPLQNIITTQPYKKRHRRKAQIVCVCQREPCLVPASSRRRQAQLSRQVVVCHSVAGSYASARARKERRAQSCPSRTERATATTHPHQLATRLSCVTQNPPHLVSGFAHRAHSQLTKRAEEEQTDNATNPPWSTHPAVPATHTDTQTH